MGNFCHVLGAELLRWRIDRESTLMGGKLQYFYLDLRRFSMTKKFWICDDLWLDMVPDFPGNVPDTSSKIQKAWMCWYIMPMLVFVLGKNSRNCGNCLNSRNCLDLLKYVRPSQSLSVCPDRASGCKKNSNNPLIFLRTCSLLDVLVTFLAGKIIWTDWFVPLFLYFFVLRHWG